MQLGIKADGQLYWNGEPVEAEVRRARMAAAGAPLDPQPELHIRADGDLAATGRWPSMLSDAAKAGLTRIGFVTDPRAGR